MKHSELIQALYAREGKPTPNQDPDTGIHYGVIPANDLDHWCVEQIVSCGDDLTYKEAIEDFLATIRAAVRVARTHPQDAADELKAWLKDYVWHQDWEELAADLLANPTASEDEDVQSVFDAIEQDWSDHYESDGSTYEYSDDEVTLTLHPDNDIFVLKSKYYTLCRECSPCAPNAGYLTDQSGGYMKSYCLPQSWFEDDKAPYDIYLVETGELVYKAEENNDN